MVICFFQAFESEFYVKTVGLQYVIFNIPGVKRKRTIKQKLLFNTSLYVTNVSIRLTLSLSSRFACSPFQQRANVAKLRECQPKANNNLSIMFLHNVYIFYLYTMCIHTIYIPSSLLQTLPIKSELQKTKTIKIVEICLYKE